MALFSPAPPNLPALQCSRPPLPLRSETTALGRIDCSFAPTFPPRNSCIVPGVGSLPVAQGCKIRVRTIGAKRVVEQGYLLLRGLVCTDVVLRTYSVLDQYNKDPIPHTHTHTSLVCRGSMYGRYSGNHGEEDPVSRVGQMEHTTYLRPGWRGRGEEGNSAVPVHLESL